MPNMDDMGQLSSQLSRDTEKQVKLAIHFPSPGPSRDTSVTVSCHLFWIWCGKMTKIFSPNGDF